MVPASHAVSQNFNDRARKAVSKLRSRLWECPSKPSPKGAQAGETRPVRPSTPVHPPSEPGNFLHPSGSPGEKKHF